MKINLIWDYIMIKKKPFTLLITMIFSTIFAIEIELNNKTNVHFEILSNQSLSMHVELGNI